MGENLYTEFLNERVTNLAEAVTSHGVLNLLEQFEAWLKEKGHLKT